MFRSSNVSISEMGKQRNTNRKPMAVEILKNFAISVLLKIGLLEIGNTEVGFSIDIYKRKNEQLDQCCQQLVAMLCCTLFNNVVLHPVNNCML